MQQKLQHSGLPNDTSDAGVILPCTRGICRTQLNTFLVWLPELLSSLTLMEYGDRVRLNVALLEFLEILLL